MANEDNIDGQIDIAIASANAMFDDIERELGRKLSLDEAAHILEMQRIDQGRPWFSKLWRRIWRITKKEGWRERISRHQR